MAKQKHDELTADDPLKLQEGPPSKRTRVSSSVSVDSGRLVKINGLASSTSSPSPPDQEEEFQDEAESFLGQVDDEQIESCCLQSEEAIADSGRLKLSRANPISTTRTPRLAQIPKHSIRSFNDMGVSSVLEAVLHRMSICKPTKIQAACIPPILAGAVLVVSALCPGHSVNTSF